MKFGRNKCMNADLFVELVSNNIEELLALPVLKDDDFTKKLFNQTNESVSFYRNVIEEAILQPEYHSKILMFTYRFGRYVRYHIDSEFWESVYQQLNRKLVEEQLNSSFSRSIEIGWGTYIFHPYNIIINNKTKIGKHVVLRGNTTIGNNGNNKLASPIIEDNVEIGINANIFGPISIGHNSKIGGGAVVVKSAPAYSVLVGNPARNVSKKAEENTDR